MDFPTLALYNPWWSTDSDSESLNTMLTKGIKGKQFQRDYLNRLDLSSNGVTIIRGPRQIGKSTLMKTAIASLIGVQPRRAVMYLPLDTVSSFAQLRTLLLQFLQFSQNEEKRYVFIDEITMVDRWQRAVKEVRDNTLMSEDVFVLTGSSAWDLKRDSERLPGRKGDIQSDHVLLPLTFREYLSHRLGPLPPRKSLNEILTLSQGEMMEWALIEEKLKVEWAQYQRSGGIPSVIEACLTGKDTESLIQVFWDILIGDIERLGLSRSKLIQVLTYIGRRITSRLSWNGAASEIEIDTKTFQKYVEALGKNFILITMKALDIHTGFPAEKKQKKLYFCDRFLLDVMQQKLGVQLSESAIIENLFAANCLFSLNQSLENGLDEIIGCGYWYSKEGHEVDLLIDRIPIELKYQNHIQRSDLSTISKTFKRGIVVSKQTMDMDQMIKVIPIHLFLAMI